MKQTKTRILFVGESSYLSTGFAVFNREILNRLYQSQKYDLAEFGVYGESNDRRNASVPWIFFHNMPRNNEEAKVYNSGGLNQFGEWKFEEVALEFRPDIIFSARDWWMDEFIGRSPFRPYYYWAAQPTVDAMPQDEQWLATFCDANAVFTYSDWGLEVLKTQCRDRIRLVTSTPPGADLEAYRPIQDKAGLRRQMGIREDALVVGTIMRNQARKLYPDLFKAFSRFLQTAPDDIANRSYLYAHTAFPDVGWDISRLLKENAIGHRTLFTYRCKKCNAVFPSLFQDARGICKNCGCPFACMPNSSDGIPNKILGLIMNLFDVYVQFANSEGFGMPAVEAAACGLPVMAVDYSAMSDIVRKLGGYPIPVRALIREPQTHCYRASPDEDAFLSLLNEVLILPESLRRRKGFEARRTVETYYTWDRTTKILTDHFDSIQTIPQEATWLSPPKFHQPVTEPPQGLNNEQFVRWGIVNIAGRPDLANSYMAARMVRDLNFEASSDVNMAGLYFNDASVLGSKPTFRPFGRKEAMEELMKICGMRNHWESRRAERLKEMKK